MSRSIPILLYHHIAPDRDIRPDDFERQLKRLLDDGYQSLSLDGALECLSGGSRQVPKAFAVTFDDGYLDVWTHAFPVLKRLGVRATVYLVTKFVEDRAELRQGSPNDDTRSAERKPGGFLSWKEARVMAESGLVTFGSHTHTHRDWDRRRPYADLMDELRESKQLIEQHLGEPCRHLAWPWGDCERPWKKAAREAGYSSAATTRAGANARGFDPYALQRVNVSRPTADWLAQRLRVHDSAWHARLYGLCYGWDKRFKIWWNAESPYHA